MYTFHIDMWSRKNNTKKIGTMIIEEAEDFVEDLVDNAVENIKEKTENITVNEAANVLLHMGDKKTLHYQCVQYIARMLRQNATQIFWLLFALGIYIVKKDPSNPLQQEQEQQEEQSISSSSSCGKDTLVDVVMNDQNLVTNMSLQHAINFVYQLLQSS